MIAEDRKAEDCLALDMTQLTPMADYYMICHGNSERQVQAIAKAIKDAVEEGVIFVGEGGVRDSHRGQRDKDQQHACKGIAHEQRP